MYVSNFVALIYKAYNIIYLQKFAYITFLPYCLFLYFTLYNFKFVFIVRFHLIFPFVQVNNEAFFVTIYILFYFEMLKDTDAAFYCNKNKTEKKIGKYKKQTKLKTKRSENIKSSQ